MLACTPTAGVAAQTTDLTILVAGSPVALSRPAERIDGEWFLPLTSVARALGIEVDLAPEVNGLRARSGAIGETVYDGRTGEIRYGGLVIAAVRNFRQIVLVGPVETVLFPTSGIVALLGVDASEDPGSNVMRIEPAGGLRGGGFSAPAFRFAGLDYTIGVTAGEREIGHYTALRSEALASGVVLSSNWLLSGRGSEVGVRQGLAQADFGEQRVLGLGDQTFRTSVDALLTSFRGLGYRTPIGGGFEADVYGGRGVGTTHAAFGVPGLLTFDSNVAGFGIRRRLGRGEVSLSGSWFDGDKRSGSSAGAAFVRITPRNQLRVQTVFGRFSGLSARTGIAGSPAGPAGPLGIDTTPGAFDTREPVLASRLPVDGTALGLSILDTFSASRLSVTAQLDHYGRNFLTAREDAQFNAQTSRRLTGSFRPFGGASLFASINDRTFVLGDPTTIEGVNYGAQGRLPGAPLQLGYFASSETDSASAAGTMDMSQYSATLLDFRRYSGSVYYTVSRFGGETTRNVTAVVSRDFGRHGRVSAHEQLQVDSSRRVGVQWERDLRTLGGSMRAGVERTEQLRDRRVEYVPLGLLAFKLPFSQQMNISYSGDRGGRTLSLSLSGPIARRRDVERGPTGRASISPNGTLDGQVYFDADGDGAFGSSADTGLPEITVWLDNTTSIVTDARGVFRFPSIVPGAHPVRAALDGVPADLAFAETPERTIAVLPYSHNAQNFRVVRTGSVTARVTYLEDAGDSAIPIERPLADVRVVANGEHDSLTDVNGYVLLAALPPGTYHLRIDPGTVPAGYIAKQETIRVDLRPGESVRDLKLVLTRAPKEIIRRELSQQ